MGVSGIKWRNIKKLSFERHPDQYDDGLIVGDGKQSNSELNKIVQPKRRQTNRDNTNNSNYATQGSRFTQRST